MADWSQLPYDLISMIANRVPAIEDFLSLSSVCHSWRSVYRNKSWSPGPHFPWLMLSENRDNEPTRAFFSFYKNQHHVLPLPEAHSRRCWGSSCGWVFTLGLDLQIHLLNPITRIQIDLPPQSTFSHQPNMGGVENQDWVRTHFIYKALVFNITKDKNFLVFAIHGDRNHLAFAKPGFDSWVSIESSTPYIFRDVVVFDSQFFAICDVGTLVLVEIDGDSPSVRRIASPPNGTNGGSSWDYFFGGGWKVYLVESSGDLLLLCRHQARSIIDFSLETVSFEVFKFDFNAKEWIELDEFGDRALFIGDNCSMSISSLDVNCKANSIYFTDDNPERWPPCEEDHGKCDIGVFNMVDKSVELLDIGEVFTLHYSCPVWLMPALSE